MNDDHRPESPPPAGADAAEAFARRLDDLEDAYLRALAEPSCPPDELLGRMRRDLDGLRAAAAGISPGRAAECIRRLRAVRELHDRLAVLLALRREELTARRRRVGRGRRSLRAYGGRD
ncbi:MAG: hypothetical protein J7M21_02870 [Planctomycetes bacterium]|nr:hypothetical protein [Planctomycetota bacterium]